MKNTVWKALVCGAASALAACATSDGAGKAAVTPQWAANGWLTPGPTGEPELIGVFADKKACEAAVEDWLSRQVVGNPIHGECLPIDRR